MANNIFKKIRRYIENNANTCRPLRKIMNQFVEDKFQIMEKI